MSYGRFKGGKHFSKQAIKAGSGTISPAQIKQFKTLGIDVKPKSMSYDEAAFRLKELKRK